MTPAAQHTPELWRVVTQRTRGGRSLYAVADGPSDEATIIATMEGSGPLAAAAAARIVVAVNSTPALLAASEAALFALGRGGANGLDGPNRAEWEQLRAAVLKARS